MSIIKMKCNHISNPLGYMLDTAVLSWITKVEKGSYQIKASVAIATDRNMQHLVYNSGEREDIDSIAHSVKLNWSPRTRYYWRVRVWTDADEVIESDTAWFETGKRDEPWHAKWITSPLNQAHPYFSNQFELSALPISARLYASSAGLYEVELNGSKIGDEYLTPSSNDYDTWLQIQTYDVTTMLQVGRNDIEALLGAGWAIGRFGFGGGKENIYSDQFGFLAELVVLMSDGTELKFGTDASWKAGKSYITESNIYDGETQDSRISGSDEKQYAVEIDQPICGALTDRLSLPVICKETRSIEYIINTANGDTVLDFGQNMSGWVTFTTEAPAGTTITLEYGEFMQEGEFHRDNLLTAKQRFTYISDGNVAFVRPRFTFFGFRYVRVIGLESIQERSIQACVLYSDMETTGDIETSNPLVNRLFQNALWGQKSNFVDVPTDCPQRDERLGWTGDAQVFAQTASFNMDTAAFFRKYLFDLKGEQAKYNGAVPTVVPKMIGGETYSAAWGDAATIIPWQQYMQYGDPAILEQQWESMKSWVEYIRSRAGAEHLWLNDFHFGDWLALDSATGSMSGGTIKDLVATAYYAHSVELVAKTAKVLGYQAEEQIYNNLFEQIQQAFLNEFVSPNGRIVSVTQTAQIVPLEMGLLPKEWRQKTADTLAELIVKAGYRLQTGFVGTPFLCKTLSDYGHTDLAYKLLLNEEMPGWLYPIKMGATTIWERWDSVMPSGKMAEHSMNSLNHYAYGSIVNWMVQEMAGIQPMENSPGYRIFRLAPKPNGRITTVKASYESKVGTIHSSWQLSKDGKLAFSFTVPFHAKALLQLPDCDLKSLEIESNIELIDITQKGNDCCITLQPGEYAFSYYPLVSYMEAYNSHSDLHDLLADEKRTEIVRKHIVDIDTKKHMIYGMKLANLHEMHFITGITKEQLEALDQELNEYYKLP